LILGFDFLFGCLYRLLPGSIENLNPLGFAGAFFFSVETLATAGYGDMHPQTMYGHAVAMVEMFVGLMMLALVTGFMFARFSDPEPGSVSHAIQWCGRSMDGARCRARFLCQREQ
jgi:inward rectifier potassium channel